MSWEKEETEKGGGKETHLMRISDQTRNCLSSPRTPHHAQPLLEPMPSLTIPPVPVSQFLQPLIQHPLDRALRDAEVRGGETAVEPPDAFVSDDVPDAVEGGCEAQRGDTFLGGG